MSKPVTHRAPVILIYVTALFRMRFVAVGNHALFISKDLEGITVWDDLLHVRCCSNNVAFWVHSYLTEGNVIMCISDVVVIIIMTSSIFSGCNSPLSEG